jgi:3-hydroxybutyryl-CoA dehydratase
MSETLTFEDVEVGLGLKPVKESITQETINTYADAAGDFNPVHVDPEWAAKNTPFKGTIAHGMTSLAFISRLVNANFGKAWLLGGSMDVSFKQPVRPGDTILAKAKVTKKKIEDGKKILELSVFCENQDRDAVITGKATIAF